LEKADLEMRVDENWRSPWRMRPGFLHVRIHIKETEDSEGYLPPGDFVPTVAHERIYYCIRIRNQKKCIQRKEPILDIKGNGIALKGKPPGRE
jgi:hypothetical protein